MRLLQFGDLHLGMENFGRIDPASGVHTRLLDFLNTLDQIVEIAISQKVDAVIFTGDAYRTRDPSPTCEREFAKRLRHLTREGIEVVLITGNHDVPNTQGRANSLDIFGAVDIPGLYVSREPQIIKILHGKLQILTMPWVNPSLLLSKKRLAAKDAQKLTLDLMSNIWQKLLAKASQNNLPTVVAVHGSIEGSTYLSDSSILFGSDLPLPKSWFLSPIILHTAAGHIHKYQVLDSIVYAGSPDYIDFGEEKEKKGVVLIDIKDNQATHKFLPLKVRQLLTIKVVAKAENPIDEILATIKNNDVKDKIVRLKIFGTLAQKHTVSERQIYQALQSAYHISGIVWELDKSISKLQTQNLAQKKPVDLLRLYLKKKSISQTKVDKLTKLFLEITQSS